MPEHVIMQTIAGSHAWGMNRPDSDYDLFVMYEDSTRALMTGLPYGGSHFDQKTPGLDRQVHEVGHVVDQLIKGNINFIQGVTSPCVQICNKPARELRVLAKTHISAKGLYDSAYGMAKANYRKYLERPDVEAYDPTPKRCATIVRSCRFTAQILEFGEFNYANPGPCTVQDVEWAMKELQEAFARSTRPHVADPSPFRHWLLRLRESQLA